MWVSASAKAVMTESALEHGNSGNSEVAQDGQTGKICNELSVGDKVGGVKKFPMFLAWVT